MKNCDTCKCFDTYFDCSQCSDFDEWQQKDVELKSEINHPNHYADRKIETITYIRDNMTKEQFQGYLEGNILKYISRYKKKNGLQDLLKANWYLNKLIQELTDDNRTNL